MALLSNKEKQERAERRALSKIFSALLHKPVRVLDIEPAQAGQIGYTSADNAIHYAMDHPCMAKLNEHGKRAFRTGVAVHEFMHQMITDFVILNRALISLPPTEKKILHEIQNYVEDARIEHFAYQFIGGQYLKCLQFAVAWTYKTSPRLEEMQTPFEQFMMAIQHFGDMGIPKGKFTFPEARECFEKIAPIFYQATLETNSRKVMKYSKEIFEESRPLWQDQKNLEEMLERMQEMADKTGRNGAGSASGSANASASSEGEGEGGSASANRSATVKELSRREYERLNAEGRIGSSGSGQKVKLKDAKTAEEAQEAADEARADANDAAEAAADAAQAAKEAQQRAEDAKGTANEKEANREALNAKRAADRAQRAADRAESAAQDAQKHADAAKDAAASGDKEAEERNAKAAGQDALRANAAAMAAQNADDAANGKGETSGSNGANGAPTAQDAAESANDAADAANAAEEAAKEAEARAKEAAASGDAEAAEKAQKDAETARKAADAAREAANKAKEAAEASEKASEDGNDIGESANARNAASAARKAQREAAKAQRAADGRQTKHTPGEKANEAEMFDYNQKGDSEDDSEFTDRAINGARPDYSNCDPEDIDDDYVPVVTEFDVEDYTLTDDDFKSIETEVESCLAECEREDVELSRDEREPLPEFDIRSARISDATTCLNVKIHVDDTDQAMVLYQKLMTKLTPGINSLYNRLKNIFMNDCEEIERRTSGKVNVKRLHTSTMTARVFDKHRAPADKAAAAVVILVDESGSMSGSSSETAKQSAITFAEVFHRLNIPVYVMGFTADTSQHDAVHMHYVTWRNTMNERLRLLNISARANNFDGYSIRYGGKLLEKVNSEHKLMIVISDGSPAASAYHGVSGIADTKEAVREVRNHAHADVLGVLIGNDSVEEIKSMYENDFIQVKSVRDLTSKISGRIVQIVKKWE